MLISEEEIYQGEKNMQYKIQFSIRLIVLILSVLSSSTIILTCLITKGEEKFHWNIKLIIAQSVAEFVATVLALCLNYSCEEHVPLCAAFGYIRFSNWLTSLLISYTMVIVLYFGNTSESKYRTAQKQIFKIILACYVIPYLWLLTPLIKGKMGPTGWMLYSEQDPQKFFIFCGFKIFENEQEHEHEHDLEVKWIQIIWYTIFFTIPLGVTAVLSYIFSIKNKAKVDQLFPGIQDQSLEFERKIMIFPKIYILAWICYFFVRYIDMFKADYIYHNLPLYMIYSFIYLGFDLHICLACYHFFIDYEEFLCIKYCYKEILKGKCPKRNPKLRKSSITEGNQLETQE